MTDYRALCAEILQKLDRYEDGQRVNWDAWRNNARAALARWGCPKSPSLKKQALSDLKNAYNADQICDTTYKNIRRALEALSDD